MNISSLGSQSSEDGDHGVEDIITAKQMMHIGLTILKFSIRKIQRAKHRTNRKRFTSHYGCSPRVASMIYEDLQRTQVAAARVSGKQQLKVRHFLMALHMLKVYPTEIQREAIFDLSPSYARKWVWFYVEKIAALKADKIVWPDNWDDEDIWIISVDGTHFWIKEPQHPEWSMDETYYSHKYNKAGLNYELGIDLARNRLVWMNGPFPAGSNDISIFIQHGLRDKLLTLAKVAIGDAGYNGHPLVLSTPNPLDDDDVKLFKSRALKRHEKFNGHIKTFRALDTRFRHSIARFQNVVEAVCVICQYQIETDKPLFDILVEGIL